jgi:hypothetical protein
MFSRLFQYLRKMFGPPIAPTVPPEPLPRIPWKLCVVLMDHADKAIDAEPYIKEMMDFVWKHSEFAVEVIWERYDNPHGYRELDGGTVWLDIGVLPAKVIEALPKADSYLFLFKLFGRPSPYNGTTMGHPYGIMKGGEFGLPWATIPIDGPEYKATPFEGFRTQAGQITVHEVLNCIGIKVEQAPNFCKTTFSIPGEQGVPSYDYERGRIKSIKPECYARLRNSLGSNPL